ncbi:MAG: hypothetical protein JXB32_12060 [Deltaproteobacteria bacterium]|nr:hypothetical protein [Deltaproteobacteria bacterium]
MIGRWIKLFGTLRPWMVAVAVAAAPLTGCSKDGAARAGGEAGAPCEPTTVYGPPICRTDEDCRGPGQEGWICSPEPMTFDDGCGKMVEWGRVCLAGSAAGAAASGGPAPSPPSGGPWPAARTDLPPPLPLRDVGPSEE